MTQHSHVGQHGGHDQAIRAHEGLARGLDSLLAVCRERDVGAARVAAVERPLRLAMAHDEDARGRHGLLAEIVLSVSGEREREASQRQRGSERGVWRDGGGWTVDVLAE